MGQKPSRKIKWIVIIGLILIVGVAVAGKTMSRGLPVDTAKVEKGPIRTYVEDKAKTTLPRIHRLTMPLDGRIEPIDLEPGDEVKKGQVVARLDTADLDTDVELAEARLAEIEAEIRRHNNSELETTAIREADATISATSDAVQSAKETVKASKERLDFATWWLKATENLATSGNVAQLKLREARKDYVEAKVTLTSDQFTASAAAAILEAVKLGPIYVEKWLNLKDLKDEVLAEQKRSAEVELKQAGRNREKALIHSPVDGVVLKRHVENLRFLPAGAMLLEIGDLKHLEVTAEILSEEAVLIAPGNDVDIFGPAIGPKPVPGKVKRVDPAGVTKLSSLGVEQQRVDVIVTLDPAGLEKLNQSGRTLGLNYRTRVRIYTAGKDEALIVPRTALFRGAEGQWELLVVTGGRAELRTVKVGLANDNIAEILEGVKQGETVIKAPPKSLKPGEKVMPVNG